MSKIYTGSLIGFIFIFLTACAGDNVEFSKERLATQSVTPTPAAPLPTFTPQPIDAEDKTIRETLDEEVVTIRYPYSDMCSVNGKIVHYVGYMDVDYKNQTSTINIERFEKFCGEAPAHVTNYKLQLGQYTNSERFFGNMKNLIEKFKLTHISKEERRAKAVGNAQEVIDWYDIERPNKSTWDATDHYNYGFAEDTKKIMNDVCSPSYDLDYKNLSQINQVQADISDREVIFISKSRQVTVSTTVLDQTTNYDFYNTKGCKDIIMPKRVFNEGVNSMFDKDARIYNSYQHLFSNFSWYVLAAKKNFTCLVYGLEECSLAN